MSAEPRRVGARSTRLDEPYSTTTITDYLTEEAARSVSDGESDGERRARRGRRKRGGPPTPVPFEEEPKEVRKRRRRDSKRDRYGMAPHNSTQFLLEDREARADVEHENEQKFEAAERRRIRSMSGGYDGCWSCEPTTTTTTSTTNSTTSTTSGAASVASSSSSSSEQEEEADREMEREFETDYLAVKRERIQSMTRSQLAQELLERDHDTQLLAQELGSKETENRHLRQLLSAHGISLEAPVTSSTIETTSVPAN